MDPEHNGRAPAPGEAWIAQLRLARARALARGVEIDWERLAVPAEEREETERLAAELPPPPAPAE